MEDVVEIVEVDEENGIVDRKDVAEDEVRTVEVIEMV